MEKEANAAETCQNYEQSKDVAPTEEPEAALAGARAEEPRPGTSSEDPECELPSEENESENERPRKTPVVITVTLTRRKRKTVFDNWMIRLPTLSRKMLSVLLVETFVCRLKM